MHCEVPSPDRSPERERRANCSAAATGAGPEYWSRRDVQLHLGISERAVDRFIRAHALKCGSARQVLVELEAYAACLIAMRRRSTRDSAAVPLPARGHTLLPPIEYAPGLDVCALLFFEEKKGAAPNRRMKFLLQERGKAPPATSEEFDRMTLHTEDFLQDRWACAILDKIATATKIMRSLESTAQSPACPDASEEARHVRTCLEWCQSIQGTVSASGLSRLARDARGDQHGALFEAFARSIGDSARHGAFAPRELARHPLLDEGALATLLHREPPTLKRWRVRGEGPVFIRIGRLIRYSCVDVDAWLRHPGGR